MHKDPLLRQTELNDTVQILAPSPCGLSEADASDLGHWSKEEVLLFLENLLEGERAGTKAFAAVGRAADLHVADLVFDSELAQGAICVLLKKEVYARGGVDRPRQMNTAAGSSPKFSFQQTITFALRNQTRLSNMIEEAVLNILDPKLNAKLMYLLLLHRKQVEQLETFLA